MSTKSYRTAPSRRDKGSKNDGSTLGSAMAVGNHPPFIEASATHCEALSIQITSDSDAGRREGNGSDDRRAIKET